MSWIWERWEGLLSRLSHREPGQGLTEYGLILVIVSIAAVVLVMSIGPKISSMFSSAGSSLK
jgi:pilus assembly protein Flp/PilA